MDQATHETANGTKDPSFTTTINIKVLADIIQEVKRDRERGGQTPILQYINKKGYKRNYKVANWQENDN